MKPRLTDLLKAVKPERALFTTFTLSLSWFEAFCLPVLKLGACEQIDLLVDSREANKLNEETSSVYAGNAFRIIPVHMSKSGIFHPKIAYLQGEQDDTLVIGSGNLTHPGQGGNLEVIDAVNAKEHPHVFEEFAEFAKLFTKRPGLAAASMKALTYYATRAQTAAKRASGFARERARSAWFIHTLSDPAQSQLALLAQEQLDSPVELTVLSPYHTPSGAAIKALAESCGVSRSRVGLRVEYRAGAKEELLVSPFEKNAKEKPKRLSYVVAETGLTPRFAHAKCFEVKGSDGYLVMTGSVNATWQSLCETRNVEVALVRRLAQSPFKWRKGEPDDYIPCDYSREHDETPLSALQASWADSTITGSLSPNSRERTVRLEVWSRARCEFAVSDVTLTGAGDFAAKTSATCDTERALRVKLVENGDVLASGWLNVERELSCPPHDRDISRAAANIVNGKSFETDLRAILEHFRRILRREQQTAPITAPLKPANASTTSVNVPIPVNIASWLPPNGTGLGLSPRTAAQVLAAAFESLRNPPPAVKAPAVAEGEAEDESEEKDDEKAPERTRKQRRPRGRRVLPDNPFAEMLKTLPLVLEVNATGPWMPALIALSATERIGQRPNPGADEDARADFGETLRQWLNRYCKFDYNEANRTRLLELFCGVAACVVYFRGARANPAKLKQDIETLAQRPIEDYEWLDLVDKALQSEAFSELDGPMREAVLDAGLTLGTSHTIREELEALIISALGPEATGVSAEFPRYQGIHNKLKLLAANQRRSGRPGRLFGVISEQIKPLSVSTPCPACNASLGTRDLVALLSRDGAALHEPGCSKPIFVGLSPSRLSDAKVATNTYAILKPHNEA